jgi:RluA family pseudouridine synthase
MKYLQFLSPGTTLREVVYQQFSPLSHLLRGTKDEAIKESLFFIREKRANRLNDYVKGRTQVTVLTPKSAFKKSVFTLKASDIAYEDAEIVVIDKPEGISTQPTRTPFEDHLYGAVIAYYTAKHPSKLSYVGLHHRLDRDTSGLILMTRKPSMNKSIADQFKDRHIKKTYTAIVTGKKPPKPFWKVTAPIGRLSGTKGVFKFGVDTKKGDVAETHFNFISSYDENTHMIECFPITGRTHQIRIHLAHSGLPILGDAVYGEKVQGEKPARMYLHATKLEFAHPKTGEPTTISSKKKLDPIKLSL